MTKKLQKLVLVSYFLSIVSCSLSQETINKDVVNNKVERSVDISAQIVKIIAKITLENAGKTPVVHFLFALEPDTKDHLAFINAYATEDGKIAQKISQVQVSEHREKSFYKVTLRKPLDPGKQAIVEIETVFTNLLSPYPSHITQSEKQLILYNGNHYFYSPYQTLLQLTTVQLSSNSVESYTKLKPVSHSENTITYGPYNNIAPFTDNKMTVHSENNSPFLSVTQLERSIEVSHWGVISVEEVVDVKHSGAMLKGAFSRYDYQRDMSGQNSVKSFKTILPASAGDIYYRDEIGNISTSHLSVLEDSVEVDLRPRFPLFGGWKTHYVLGYYVPTYEYLFNLGNEYALKMRFVDHIFDDCVIEDATVKVILPEGSRDIKLKLPYAVDKKPNQLHYTYLDTIGRPVVILHKSNLVEQHIQDFEVHYKFEKMLMLQEPLLVVIAFFLLFLVVIIYVRLDFTITRDQQKESKLKVIGLVEAIKSNQQNRLDLYPQYDAALNKYKSSHDASGFKTASKKLNSDLQSISQAIVELQAKLKQEGSEVAEKVKELQILDSKMKDELSKHAACVNDFFADKINKTKLVSTEAAIANKKKELYEKMIAINNTF